jgi:putative cell wall-binding protein
VTSAEPTAESAASVLASLVVAPAQSAGYERSYFYTSWGDPLGDGCDTRADVLKAQSSTPVTTNSSCTVQTGTWLSWYDDASWTQASDLQIDHLVPLGEAWASGAFAWTAQQRNAYANDISTGYSLQAVTSNVNESKGDDDPATWMPPAVDAACRYDQDWVLVKYKWNLTIDAAEKSAIAAQFALNGCGAEVLALPAKAGTAARPASSVTAGTQRIAGADRYGTAIQISQQNYASGVPIAYIAAGANYPDALSAASAAALAGGPLLLTSAPSLPSAVSAELVRLQPSKIVVVGGTSAVSDAVLRALRRYAPSVTRESGADRYATSRAIASATFSVASTAFIASGRNFPDALSASAAAGAQHAPVILVDGTASTLDAKTTAVLRSLGVTKIVVAGGTSAVSAGIASGLGRIAPVTRLGGSDRFSTAVLVNSAFFSSAAKAYLASGLNFPDALAGAAVAGRDGAPLYITQPNCVPDNVASALSGKGVVDRVVLGGAAALSANVSSGIACSNLPKPAPAPAPAPPASSLSPKAGEFCSTADHGRTVSGLTCSYYPSSGTWHWKRA